jgi:hypothetical protein
LARILLPCAALLVFALQGQADERSSREIVIHLNVQPMAAPKPALRYQLLPDLAELNPGNCASAFMKCFMEQQIFFFDRVVLAQRDKYQVMLLSELPVKELRGYGGSALRQADWAARLDTPDWQVLQKVQAEGMELQIGEVQQLRRLPPALKVRFRAEVAERRFDDAIRTAKTLFAFARHLGEYPTETASLVGIGAANLALDPLEEMLQQPGCPNLFWALTYLPSPLVELRKGIQGDRILATTELSILDTRAPMREDQLAKAVSRLATLLEFQRFQSGKMVRNIRGQLNARAKDEQGLRVARQRLIEAGYARDLAEHFAPLQVILLDEKRAYDSRCDEAMKIISLPFWQMTAYLLSSPSAPADAMLQDFLPHIVQTRRAQAQLEQRIALLRHVEAVRLYAAAHDGHLPGQLTDINVPLPVDPLTGKAFAYKAEGQTARIAGYRPAEESNPPSQSCYEVTVQK